MFQKLGVLDYVHTVIALLFFKIQEMYHTP